MNNGNDILADVELLRLALPRRVFTLSQIMYVADRMKWLYENRELVGGLKFTEEPAVLRFFPGPARARFRLAGKTHGEVPQRLWRKPVIPGGYDRR
jgi:tryptophanase